MRFHKEGFATIFIVIAVLIVLNLTVFLFCNCTEVLYFFLAASLVLLFIVLQFFRNPNIKRAILENGV
ncbi:MAG: hypothetical protein GXO49_06090, partial [Chlorobi bacterium]|nr:hypothetical protein [Chlorobiota bacterium]